MNDRVRPGLSLAARNLEQVLEELDRARIAILARTAGAAEPATVSAPPARYGLAATETEPAPPTVEGDGFEDAGFAPTNHYRASAYTPRPYAAPAAGAERNRTPGRTADRSADRPADRTAADGGGQGQGPGGGGGFGGGAGGNGAEGNGSGGNGGGNGNGGRRGFFVNPFAGPGRVDPTIRFVQTAIVARPEQTEEILAAALRISPTQAERIILAAIRANPDAKAQILRIARASGSIGVKSALSLLLALFLFEVFGMGTTAEAKEDLEATSRRSGSSESFAAWFTTAAVTLAILFDANAIQALQHYLALDADGDQDFATIVDKLADAPPPEALAVAALADDLGFDVVTRDGAEERAGAHGRGGGDLGGPPLAGLDALGGLGDETLSRNRLADGGPRRLPDPDFATPFSAEPGGLNLLGDEVTPDSPPPEPPVEPPREPSEDDTPATDTPDGEPPTTPMGTIDDAQAGEGDGVAVFTITRSNGDGAASVDFATVEGTALAGHDYASTAGTLHFADGQTAVSVTVALLDDGEVEPGESFQLALANPDGFALQVPAATATIVDDDVVAPTWSLTGDQLVAEGDAAAYAISMSGGPLAPGQEASVRLRLVLPGGTGGADADDFAAAFLAGVQAAIDALGPDPGIRLDGDRLIFTADAPASLTLFLQTTDDGLIEGPENYTLVIEDPSAGEIAAGDALVTTVIADNDAAALVWRLSGDQLVAEGDAPRYTVSLGEAGLAVGATASVDLSVNLPDSIGGANAADFRGAFYQDIQDAIDDLGPGAGISLVGTRLVFEGGADSFTFTLPTADDDLAEGAENYTVLIGAPSAGAVDPSARLVTTAIVDDDGADLQDGGAADMFAADVVDLGSGIDRVVDVAPAEGESLHVLDVLTGFDSAMIDIDAFIRFQERQDGTISRVDAEGAGVGGVPIDAVLLEAVHGVTVDQLMADNHLMMS